VEIVIDNDWRGAAVAPGDRLQLTLSRSRAAPSANLQIEINAPFYADPAPSGPCGPTPGLWEFEVVELFLLGTQSHYLELEFGPHGHWLALELEGVRNVVRTETSPAAVRFETQLGGNGRWLGRATIDAALLPNNVQSANAYAIHGHGDQRNYLAWSPVPGAGPDFHRLEAFAPIDFQDLPVREKGF